MSQYTTPLRTYFDQFDDGSMSTREVIEAGRKKLFDFDYPVFDEEYRNIFETNFIRNFFMREIGFETFGYFKFQLETWLLINMPYYNKVFESELLEFDPLSNAAMEVSSSKQNKKNETDNTTSNTTKTTEIDNDKTSVLTGSSDTNSEVDSTSNKDVTNTDDNFNRKITSTTPDGRLNITANDGQGVIEYANTIDENTENNVRNQTATDTGKDTSTVNQESNVSTTESDDTTVQDNTSKTDIKTLTADNIETYTEKRLGKIGSQSYSKLLTDYRASLLRVEKTIFAEMNELFMLVY